MNGKRLSLAAVISLGMFTLWTLAGCSKKNTTSYQTGGTMTAGVNGTAFTASTYVVAGYIPSPNNAFIIQGENINGKDSTGIQIEVPSNVPLNQAIPVDSPAYAIGNAGIVYATGGVEYDAYFLFGASHGSITLTTADTVNHRVAGTFSGVLYNKANSNDSVIITNGAFNSTYQD